VLNFNRSCELTLSQYTQHELQIIQTTRQQIIIRVHDAANRHVKYIASNIWCSNLSINKLTKTVNKTGERTSPCHTSLRTINHHDMHVFHFTAGVSLLYQFTSPSVIHFWQPSIN